MAGFDKIWFKCLICNLEHSVYRWTSDYDKETKTYSVDREVNERELRAKFLIRTIEEHMEDEIDIPDHMTYTDYIEFDWREWREDKKTWREWEKTIEERKNNVKSDS